MTATGMTLANAAALSLVCPSVFSAATASAGALHGEVDFRLAGLLPAGGGAAGGGGPGLLRPRFPASRMRPARTAFALITLSWHSVPGGKPPLSLAGRVKPNAARAGKRLLIMP